VNVKAKKQPKNELTSYHQTRYYSDACLPSQPENFIYWVKLIGQSIKYTVKYVSDKPSIISILNDNIIWFHPHKLQNRYWMLIYHINKQ
jgi:hypothetical protein